MSTMGDEYPSYDTSSPIMTFSENFKIQSQCGEKVSTQDHIVYTVNGFVDVAFTHHYFFRNKLW